MRYFLPADPPSAHQSLSHFHVAPCKSTNQDALHPEIYGVSFQSSDGLSIQNDSIKGDAFYEFLLSSFKNMAEHLEKGGAGGQLH